MPDYEGLARVLVDGHWADDPYESTFFHTSPRTSELLGEYPVSNWSTLDRVLDAGLEAYRAIEEMGAPECARVLSSFADAIERNADELAALCDDETALGIRPRFLEVEIPRTVSQLRKASEIAAARSWRQPVMSPPVRIASMMAPLPGPVVVIGPNNFPFAFNSVSGGDAAAALATGHPVIAKGNPGHPGTTRRLAELARDAVAESGFPPATIQLVYRTSHADGRRLVSDPRLAATAYTGSRAAGLELKKAADDAGKPIYLELSSINPIVVLPDAIHDGQESVVDTLTTSMLMGSGQFCTSPGLIFVLAAPETDVFLGSLASSIAERPGGTLLAASIATRLQEAFATWTESGAEVLASGQQGPGISFPNTVLKLKGSLFLGDPALFQEEAFGNLSIVVVCADPAELAACLASLEGNLTGSIFGRGSDDSGVRYGQVAALLRPRVGRLLMNKATTGVAVVDAMNHGGPYPSTGHPGFTAVGMPSSMDRFCMLQCYENVPDDLLPAELQASNPFALQRRVDGVWTTDEVAWG